MSTFSCAAAMDVRQRVGQNVRKFRKERGISQEELAFESGLHRNYVSDVERGTRNPTVTVIEKIGKALKVPTSSLLGENASPKLTYSSALQVFESVIETVIASHPSARGERNIEKRVAAAMVAIIGKRSKRRDDLDELVLLEIAENWKPNAKRSDLIKEALANVQNKPPSAFKRDIEKNPDFRRVEKKWKAREHDLLKPDRTQFNLVGLKMILELTSALRPREREALKPTQAQKYRGLTDQKRK